ncbi:DNA polymerase III subunit psi [Candidatus Palibaumannia cicadellinicola]|uniref:DNA polymerase III subunit psi n=1 Tax=Candidatus Palibaumannia cicadellinicola TaxID=186490 RepID=A0A0K2BLS9_9GAMM|nr:DNA polymerase III subunit psi [Candidatus Baumannia cicadellinicola]AKZ66147.1 DNA polymerase III psi subunit [Candidatus Baumannia cicadellinicola]
MSIKRELLLKQLGIMQWMLRNYQLLIHSNSSNLEVSLRGNKIKLLIIVDKQIPYAYHPLLTDVARSMELRPEHLLLITIEQVMMLPNNSHYHCWWLGFTEICKKLNGISLLTPPLSILNNDATAKRNLWRQIINAKKYFKYTQ